MSKEMREIKFRAWNKEFGMCYEASPYFAKREFYPFGITVGFSHYPEDLEEWQIMQFTGLHDKNGKEIYEGDVVKYTRKKWNCLGHPQHGKDLVDICKIYWDEERHGFGNDMRAKNGRVYSSGYLGFTDERAKEIVIEVIGNIYENPELLEKSKEEP